MTTALLGIRVVMVLAGLGLLGIGYRVSRARDALALLPFVGLVGVVGTVAVADGLAAGNFTALSIVWLVAYLAVPAAFAWFVVEYYGLPYLASRGRQAAFLAPIVIGIAGGIVRVLSPAAVGAMGGGGLEGSPEFGYLVTLAGLAQQVGIVYAGGLVLAGTALLVRTVRAYDHLDGRLGVVLSFVALWPWLAYFTTPGVAGVLALESILALTASGYVLSCLAAGFAVTRGGLFEAAPAAGTLGPQTVLAELDEAVVVVDDDERVVRTNRAARESFAPEAESVTGRDFASVVGVDVGTLADAETVELTGADGSRQFEATVSPVRDRLDRSPGCAVVLRDVTRERVRAQRLSVLNRVLRHNLRNGMTTIMGRAELIASDGSEYSDAAESILDSADDLVDLGERAHEVETMMSGPPAVEPVALADLVDAVFEGYRREYPEASLSIDVAADLELVTDRRVLSVVLSNLVENALQHNDAPTPVVTVSARTDPANDAVRVSVSDNGPGLPEQERAVIESESESPLEHGSGLGLWAVNWGVTRLGGDLAFADNEPEGTVVTVRLPMQDPDRETSPATAEAA